MCNTLQPAPIAAAFDPNPPARANAASDAHPHAAADPAPGASCPAAGTPPTGVRERGGGWLNRPHGTQGST